MKKLSLVLGIFLVGSFAACDDSSNSSGGGGSGGSGGGGGSSTTCDPTNPNGGSTPECIAYSKCEQQACDAEYKQCLGDNYASGQFGGPCADYMGCTSQCKCDTACNQGCQSKLAGACLSCFTGTLSACTQNHCQAEQKACADSQKGSGGSGGSGGSSAGGSGGSAGSGLGGSGSGAGCAELSACCPQLQNADQKSSCEQLVATNADAQCGAVLQGFKAGGLCK